MKLNLQLIWLIAAMACGQTVFSQTLEIHQISVGQGDAALIVVRDRPKRPRRLPGRAVRPRVRPVASRATARRAGRSQDARCPPSESATRIVRACSHESLLGEKIRQLRGVTPTTGLLMARPPRIMCLQLAQTTSGISTHWWRRVHTR